MLVTTSEEVLRKLVTFVFHGRPQSLAQLYTKYCGWIGLAPQSDLVQIFSSIDSGSLDDGLEMLENIKLSDLEKCYLFLICLQSKHTNRTLSVSQGKKSTRLSLFARKHFDMLVDICSSILGMPREDVVQIVDTQVRFWSGESIDESLLTHLAMNYKNMPELFTYNIDLTQLNYDVVILRHATWSWPQFNGAFLLYLLAELGSDFKAYYIEIGPANRTIFVTTQPLDSFTTQQLPSGLFWNEKIFPTELDRLHFLYSIENRLESLYTTVDCKSLLSKTGTSVYDFSPMRLSLLTRLGLINVDRFGSAMSERMLADFNATLRLVVWLYVTGQIC